MPYTIRKVRGKNCYTVKNKLNGRVMSKCTTLDKGLAQIRFLTALEYNSSFRRKIKGKNNV